MRYIDHLKAHWGAYIALYIIGVFLVWGGWTIYWNVDDRQQEDQVFWDQQQTYQLLNESNVDNVIHFVDDFTKISDNLVTRNFRYIEEPTNDPEASMVFASGDVIELLHWRTVQVLDEADSNGIVA